ncbi:PREDICTED: wee1-like protein kinase isoform X2 [Bactrocera latifrons]|uniref:wee1-like protein kinase isoform X2 n=1 Tax=Bactrocera latifrons TaxID=174628 RepID=UPI0008DCAD18|nr:PREDICTED: wee1-like protein kinase isoform X2 [Bactrocera latifrons]
MLEMEAFRKLQPERKNDADSSQEQIELNSSVEMHSPSPVCHIQPRKLRFASPQINEEPQKRSSPVQTRSSAIAAVSPPYRKVRALRLFDTPATPKTILQKSRNHLSAAVAADVARKSEIEERPRSLPLHSRVLDNFQQTANVNPFTPDSFLARNKKRCRTQFGRDNLSNQSLQIFLNTEAENRESCEEDGNVEVLQAPKRLALQDTNISRYQKEFLEISLIGIGEFGLVYQCLNRLDGCIYAIKKSIKPVAGSFFEKRALNEVWAHAVLGKHDNVVRYYSAWAEDNHMLIQNEYCNGGSLQSLIQKRFLVESELKILLLHVAEGLRYIHSNDLVHMDLKSGNIFLTKMPSLHKSSSTPLTKEYYEDGMDGIYEELSNTECITTYKIGDLGHVTSEDFSNLFKADIFSLGMTLFEAAGGGPLPKNGPEWQNLRNGEVPNIPTLSPEFNELIKLMTHPDPEKRPSSTSIFNHPILSSLESKTKSQLNQELTIEKRKNEILLRKLREAKKLLKQYEQNGANKTPPASLEQRCLRSYSRKKRTPCISSKLDGLRDRNKMLLTS